MNLLSKGITYGRRRSQVRKIKGGGESGSRGPVEILNRVDLCEREFEQGFAAVRP